MRSVSFRDRKLLAWALVREEQDVPEDANGRVLSTHAWQGGLHSCEQQIGPDDFYCHCVVELLHPSHPKHLGLMSNS